ncbi:hypothetical protein Tco_0449960 [Tanacetum coccineum]
MKVNEIRAKIAPYANPLALVGSTTTVLPSSKPSLLNNILNIPQQITKFTRNRGKALLPILLPYIDPRTCYEHLNLVTPNITIDSLDICYDRDQDDQDDTDDLDQET